MMNTKLSKSEIIDNLKEDIGVLAHKHALLAIQNDELKLYINHALDNSKEQLVRRIAELEKLVSLAHEMDTDSYTDVYGVKWLANKLIKEQSE